LIQSIVFFIAAAYQNREMVGCIQGLVAWCSGNVFRPIMKLLYAELG